MNEAKTRIDLIDIELNSCGWKVNDITKVIQEIELQNKFASIIEKIETIKDKENNKLKSLEYLHNSLMQKAFKGEINE